MTASKRNQKGKKMKTYKKFAIVVIAFAMAMSLPVGGVAVSAQKTEAKQKPLVVSPVYFNDVSACVEYSFSRLSLLDVFPCSGNWNSHTNEYRTTWAFNVKNPNKSMTAVAVKARIKMLDANGNEVINKVIVVAPNIFPGRTVWVAPMFIDNNQNPWQWELTESSGKVASATVSLLKVKWAKKKAARTPTVAADFSTAAAGACTGSCTRSTTSQIHVQVNFEGIIPNPSKQYNGYVTRVFFADNGTPLGGYRSRGVIGRGSNQRVSSLVLPKSIGSQIGSISYFVSR